MTLADFIKDLFAKGKIAKDDTRVKALLESDLSKFDVPDEVVVDINKNFLTMDAAKNDTTLKNHFFAQALSTVDSEINNLSTEYGLDDVAKQELNGINSSFKKIAAITKKVQSLEAAKAGKTTGEKAELAKTITELNAQIVAIKKANDDTTKQLTDKHVADMANASLRNKLSLKKYAGEGIDPETMVDAAFSAIGRELNQMGLVIATNGSPNTYKLTKADGTDYYKDNKHVQLDEFIDSTLAGKKLLATNSGKQDNNANPSRDTSGNGGTGNGSKANDGSWRETLEQRSQELTAANKQFS